MELRDVIFLILAILGFIWTILVNEFDYYIGGMAENSQYIIRGNMSGMALLMFIVCSFTIGYSLSRILNKEEKPYNKGVM